MADALVAEILEFWFGPAQAPGYPAWREAWFKVDPAFDAAIAARFGMAVERAVAGDFDATAANAESSLALLLLLDQFPRNVFRGTPKAFAGDRRARAIADAALAGGFDNGLPPVQRLFFYLPFEHSETLADQERCMTLMRTLDNAEWMKYAQAHRDIIARFGRFPHRNAALGRASTAEEIEFLRQPGSSF